MDTFELDYDGSHGRRERWNGYYATSFDLVVERYAAQDEARRIYRTEQQLKKLEEKNSNQSGEGEVSDEDDDEDDLRIDEAKVDRGEQMDFAKVEKRVRTTGGGSTGSVRNLHTLEDTAKYLLNLDVNSAHYDPETRFIREDPLPDADPDEKFYEETILPKSKYEEDVHINNHTSFWGSWWKDHQWGYKCCKQTIRKSYCTGAAEIEAAADLMKANITRKEASED